MKTLAQFEQETAAARAKLMGEIALATAAPVPPVRVLLTSADLPHWLIYESETMAAALEIMAAAPIVPAYAYKSTFTRIQPEAFATEKSGTVTAGPFAASLKIDQGAGYGPNAELRFFVMAGEQLCAAHVSIGPRSAPANHWQWSAAWRKDPRGRKLRDAGGRKERGDFVRNTLLSAHADHVIAWATGGDASASFEYFFMADTEEGGADHAAEQIRLIAEAR